MELDSARRNKFNPNLSLMVGTFNSAGVRSRISDRIAEVGFNSGSDSGSDCLDVEFVLIVWSSSKGCGIFGLMWIGGGD